jgi:DNA polymerase-3 subunit delta'
VAFREIIGHERAVAFLRRAAATGRAGASLIFHGPHGVGRRLTALSLAQAFNCLEDPGEGCGSCRSCTRIARVEEGTVKEGDHKGDTCQFTHHPDVHLLVPGRNEIRIDEVRSLRQQAQRKPFEGRRSTFIVDPAERMTPAAANALLKTLEEPPPTTCIILIAADPATLLPTVQSRCRLIPFHRLSASSIKNELIRRDAFPPGDAGIVAALCNGRIGHALDFDLDLYREQRETLLEILDRLAQRRPRAHIIKDAEFLGSRGDARAMERALEILESILRDALILQAGGSRESLVNVDIEDRLRGLSESMGERLEPGLLRLAGARADLRWNVNRQLLTEALLLDLAVPGARVRV